MGLRPLYGLTNREIRMTIVRKAYPPPEDSYLCADLLLRCLKILGLISFCIVTITPGNVRADGSDIQLPELIEELYQNNQELLSMEERARALRAEAPFAGSLSDPRVGVALLNLPTDSFEFDQEAMTQKQLFVAQKFPWFGTLDLSQQVAELKALEFETLVQGEWLKKATELARAWYELGLVEQSLELNKKLKTVITQILRMTEIRYATGIGIQQDILAGQVQMSELIDEEVNLRSKEQAIRGRIGSLLNRESFFTDKGPELVPEIDYSLDLEEYKKVALQHNRQIIAKKVGIDRARLEVELADKNYMPDFDLRLSYGQREPNPVTGDDRADFFSAGVTMTVPLWQRTRQDAKKEGAEKRLKAAEKSLTGISRTLPHKIESLLAEIEGAKENFALYRDVLFVQASHLAESSLAAYSVGKVEFATMLGARVRLLRIELKTQKYKYQIHLKLADLAEVIGTSPATLEGI